ncbi:MAG: N-6 DNA methylase, partial [Saprospiraceae bacterium]
MTLHNYVEILNKRFQTGISREHSYRGDLQTLLQTIVTDVLVTNEPARIKCGAPDYVITKNDIPVGYIEAKDIGIDLKSKTLKEQFNRYRNSLDNLMFTDYMDFHLYIDGAFVTSIAIAEMQDGKIVPIEKNFSQFEALITDFCMHVSQTITSSEKLSKMMAGKAKMLALVIEKALESDVESHQNSTLKQQLAAFEQILIHDITPREFADIYAQTIAYGMFAARLHDPTLPTFSRQEAAELIPKSNPFLRKMFQYIAGYDLDGRIVWIVDALADIFRATDVAGLLHNFGKSTQMNDPMIHFYENFLAEYDPKLRKARGVWYTPEPVVNFIVRAVDEVLKTEFGLKKGLADTSKTKVKVKVATKKTADRRSKTKIVDYEKEVHKVQILDPATGTGTFLAEVVKHIYKTNFKRMKGAWSNYVEKDLIPRLNGFELLMASYAMAHLKLDMLLTETGYTSERNQRLRIYLTNSLEEAHPDTGTLFANWLSTEASEANTIKRDSPVMVILGNPPYSGESANKGEWIMNLMTDYKKEPGGKEKLKERNPKWINDDYVKFMRYGQHFIEKNGEGVLAFINPHGFLDNPTFRGMRWNLLKTYDKIYTIDLHGNSKKKETAPDGSVDQNVFDIMQGVSINILVKTGKKK